MNTEGELVPLSRIADYLPDSLHMIHKSTAIRWALRGVGNPRVTLATIKIGGRRYVTRAAVERFIIELSGTNDSQTAKSATRQKQFSIANDELDKEGI
jgi:hypothetical protein